MFRSSSSAGSVFADLVVVLGGPADQGGDGLEGRTLGFTSGAPTAGRPAVVISARGGGYGPGAPNEGRDHLIPTLETVLGWSHTLGLDVTSVIPELTMAPAVPAMADLIPLYEKSLATAHEQARQLAATLDRRAA